jgi:hypothetical protein
MALRTAVSAEPAPSVPMSRSAVKPAIRSAFAASHGEDGPLRHGFLDGLQIFRAGMQEQVHVRVDQARQQGAVAQIDDFGGWRMGDRRAHLDDAFASDQHLAGLSILPVSISSRRAARSTMGRIDRRGDHAYES